MAWTLERSNLHFERAHVRLPLGVASDSGYWGNGRTVCAKRAEGARLWDIDDNEYIDYRLGGGQVILGYADPRVASAARSGIAVGGGFGLATELEFAVAERIAKLVPAAELVRFSSSGAEAIVDALRLARVFTGKDAIVVVEGGSHGVPGTGASGTGRRDRPKAREQSPSGVSIRAPFETAIHSVPVNDADRFEALLRSHRDQIGTFLIEPIPIDCASTAADAAYLGDVRALCDRFGVVLIVDEDTTGFRVARGGAQEALSVRADLCTFGSTAANGYPIAVLAGREEIMRKIGNGVVQGATYAAHPVSLAVADKTLEIIDKTDALEKIAKYGWWMREGMSQVMSRRSIPHTFVGPPSMSGLCIGEMQPLGRPGSQKIDDAFCSDLVSRLHGSGILCEPDFCGPWFVSTAHDELCLAETLAKFEHAVDGALERMAGAREGAASEDPRPPPSFASPG
ncbi:MAG: aminotransferase class III-fold pyridoxal phosphate-dependent enzyme [Deltaproteobacteria bacterium]|nr:aminotransferase class III-fold pyridoxal phosphate-dependent enzyme [Deltaproteobacteria bacterium]